jgi:uncharacterized protein
MTATSAQFIAFEGVQRIAAGALIDVALAVRKRAPPTGDKPVLVFDAAGQVLDLDLRGSEKDLRARFTAAAPPPAEPEAAPPEAAPRRPGRPKLGVVPREVTLLPRHWDWLNAQPGGASVALRKLVEEARRARSKTDILRTRQEAAYRFMRVIAGNFPDYEDVNRALFAGDAPRFTELTNSWPADIRDHARLLATAAFAAKPA